jgi:hypothetical protein
LQKYETGIALFFLLFLLVARSLAGILMYTWLRKGLLCIWAGVSSKSVALISLGLISIIESVAVMLYHVVIELTCKPRQM